MHAISVDEEMTDNNEFLGHKIAFFWQVLQYLMRKKLHAFFFSKPGAYISHNAMYLSYYMQLPVEPQKGFILLLKTFNTIYCVKTVGVTL